MMNSRHSRHRSAGFSLLEVLIAVVILSFGLLALAGLQGALFKASTDVKAQSVGLGLASEKLEYFRGYVDTAAYQAITNGSDVATTIGGISYTRDWTVTRYANPTAGGVFVSVANTGATTSAYVANNEFKRIRVNVAWTDAQNVAQKVSLEDAIAGLDPGDSRKIGKLTSGTTNRGPQVRIFDPAQQQEGVIPIGIGTGDANTAATNPKPLVNGSSVIETRFDVLTYSGLQGTGSSATAIEQARVETSLVACQCDYAKAPAGFGKRPTYWNGYRYTIPEASTTAALAGEETSAANSQSNLCSVCCRDHHDPSTLALGDPKFDPRDSNHSGGHYLLTGSTLSAQITSSSSPAKYTEACRVIRVAGVYRVAADSYNDYLNLLDTNSMVSTPDIGKPAYVPTAAKTLSYQNFVKAYLDSRVAVTGSPSADTRTNRNVILAEDVSTTSSLENPGINGLAGSISLQSSILFVKNLQKWLHLRGLFVDYLEDSAVQAIKDAKQACATSTLTDREQCVLPVLPFTSINLTELGNWTPRPPSTELVVASSTFDSTLASTPPVRGLTIGGSAPTDTTTTNAVATIRRSNSGLTTLVAGISTEDALNTAPATAAATQPFTMSGFGLGSGGGSYTVSLASSPSSYVYQTANIGRQYLNSSFGNLVSACNYTTGSGDPINCTSGNLTAQTLTVGGYNYSVTNLKTNQTSLGTAVALSCINVSDGMTVSHTFAGFGVLGARTCKNWQVTNSTLGVVGSPSPSDGVTAESTPVVFAAGIPGGSNIKFTLVAQPDSLSYNCSYSGTDQTVDANYTVTTKACP